MVNRSTTASLLLAAVSTITLLLAPTGAHALCVSDLRQADHELQVFWKAPTHTEDKATRLTNNDILGYSIWAVDRQNPQIKIKELATAERGDTSCTVNVPSPGIYTIAMVTRGQEDSPLSQAMFYKARSKR